VSLLCHFLPFLGRFLTLLCHLSTAETSAPDTLGNGFAYVAGFHGGRLACFVVNEGSLLIHTGNVTSMAWFSLSTWTVKVKGTILPFLHHPSIIALLKPLPSPRHDTGVHSAYTWNVPSMKPLPSLSYTLCCDSTTRLFQMLN